jgi:ABC-type uncharacterized transport system YnjBCD ATPase subunit
MQRANSRAIHKNFVACLQTAEEEFEVADEASQASQLVAEALQQRVHHQLAAVVSRCLALVFDDPYEFKLTFEKKRNRTECRLSFVRNGFEVDPTTASGGGVVDVASFALRLAALVLSRPRRRLLVVLDEPFKFVSLEYRENVRIMLETLAAEMGIQFIMVTHIQELQTGKVIEL